MRLTFLLLGALVLSSTAQAFDAKRFHIGYFQETESASTEVGREDNTLTTFRQASFNYRLNDIWTARFDLRSETTDRILVKTQEDKDKGIAKNTGDDHSRLNPRIGVQGVIWKSGRYSLFTQFIADISANLNNNGSKAIIRPRVYNSFSIQINEKNTLAVSLAVRRWLYQQGNAEQKAGYNLQLDGFTEVTYRLTLNDMMTFQAYYFAFLRSRKEHSQADLIHENADLDVGLEFAFKDVGTFMPFVGIDLQNSKGIADQNYEDLALGFWISTRFF